MSGRPPHYKVIEVGDFDSSCHMYTANMWINTHTRQDCGPGCGGLGEAVEFSMFIWEKSEQIP